jgi:hypothetical protein
MFNYLAKAAHLNADPGFALSSKEFQVCYEHMLQLGALTSEGMYHRSLDQKTPFFNYLQMNQDIGSTSIHSLVPLETTNVTDLYCTRFVPILDLSKREEAAEILAKQYEENIDLPLEELPEFPVLIDITDQIGQDLITYNNPERIKLYEQKAALAKQNVNEIFEAILLRCFRSIRDSIPTKTWPIPILVYAPTTRHHLLRSGPDDPDSIREPCNFEC